MIAKINKIHVDLKPAIKQVVKYDLAAYPHAAVQMVRVDTDEFYDPEATLVTLSLKNRNKRLLKLSSGDIYEVL